jgi:hypothetical protein
MAFSTLASRFWSLPKADKTVSVAPTSPVTVPSRPASATANTRAAVKYRFVVPSAKSSVDAGTTGAADMAYNCHKPAKFAADGVEIGAEVSRMAM